MTKRNCATSRRVERLKALGRLADAALPPASADRVLSLIGDELVQLGLYPWRADRGDPKATIN